MKNKPEKIRLDVLLVQKGLAESRHQAQALIMANQVTASGQVQTKSGTLIPEDAELEILKPLRYVGRGGLKMEKALNVFRVNPNGKICLDVGASTGGFTDCLLQNGAAKVYAVDVGKGQLAWRLRQDERVVCAEKVNARELSRREVPEPISLCVMDVSFISVTKILPALKGIVSNDGEFLILIKPQFEAGREQVKKGIVRDRLVHEEVLRDTASWAAENGFAPLGAAYSPVTGSDGNIEFFLHLNFNGPPAAIDFAAVVDEAHQELKR